MAGKRFPREVERIIRFHGHLCGGVIVGYRATKLGMKRLRAGRATDEEVIAIVENDSCAVDAVQVISGCTFGKGNLFFHDYGKHVYTFALRPSGRAVRVSKRPGPRLSPEDCLATAEEDLFWVEETTIELPRPARIYESVTCDRCAEPVMETRTRKRNGRTLCIPCANHRGNGRRPSIKRHRRRVSGARV